MRKYMLVLWMFALFFSMPLAAQEAGDTASMQLFADESVVENSVSTLERHQNGLSMIMHTYGLTPGNVYTVWWVIFNNPAGCSDGVCGDDDIFMFDEEGNIVLDENGFEVFNEVGLNATLNSVLGATGAIIAENGEGHFSANLGLGQSPGLLWGPGLLLPVQAEVHLVVRDHGPPEEDIDLLNAQIMTFGGGCQVAPPGTGMLGEYPCADEQFAVHLP